MNYFKVTLFLSILTLSSINAWELELKEQSFGSPENTVSSSSTFSSSSEIQADQILKDTPSRIELGTIALQQKALENLLELSEKFKRSHELTAQTSLVEQQIQIKALEKLAELAKSLDKKKKSSSSFSVKKLLDPIYVLDQMANGVLHIGGRVYDKCETAIVTATTYALVMYFFFPGVWSLTQTTLQGVKTADQFIADIVSNPEIISQIAQSVKESAIDVASEAASQAAQTATDVSITALSYCSHYLPTIAFSLVGL